MRPYGQKLVKFCTHTHRHTHAAKLVVEIRELKIKQVKTFCKISIIAYFKCALFLNTTSIFHASFSLGTYHKNTISNVEKLP